MRIAAFGLGLILVSAAVAAGPLVAAQEGTQGAKTDCARIAEAIAKTPVDQRVEIVRNAFHDRCKPMAPEVWTALRNGTWTDGTALSSEDRVLLVTDGIDKGYGEAESLAVYVIESGEWPGGGAISIRDGGTLIRGLKSALNPYRVHLLLDVYEQQDTSWVRTAVLETLRDSKLDEALLPALEAYWQSSNAVQKAGVQTLTQQPEKTPHGVLARLIRKLPDGPLLTWAAALGERHPSPEVNAAMKERGLVPSR